jgi:hypothetical protein
MKAALRILLIGAALIFGVRASALGDGYDVFNPIVKYFGQGEVDKLSAWFADNLELSILSSNNDCSKNQAKQILKTFFSNHNPRSLEIIHTASKANSKYALGELNAGGEVFRVTLFVSNCNGEYKIQQIKIDQGRIR